MWTVFISSTHKHSVQWSGTGFIWHIHLSLYVFNSVELWIQRLVFCLFFTTDMRDRNASFLVGVSSWARRSQLTRDFPFAFPWGSDLWSDLLTCRRILWELILPASRRGASAARAGFLGSHRGSRSPFLMTRTFPRLRGAVRSPKSMPRRPQRRPPYHSPYRPPKPAFSIGRKKVVLEYSDSSLNPNFLFGSFGLCIYLTMNSTFDLFFSNLKIFPGLLVCWLVC